ncbi:MAG: MBL fold metallo-hydrolase [Saprospiraceae bacterium]|jgi:metallo-beta-lactamase family protein|nr:MBL fold metallo-hydrolase [Saprospiraceae bacterium]
MKIMFCGAAREVTGSAHLITLNDGFRILLDCGLYQGRSERWKAFNYSWYFPPEELDVLVLSHAHIDHSGRIPRLVKEGFTGPIHATHATRSLCAIMLLDSAKIQESDTAYYNKRHDEKEWRDPLYTDLDVQNALKLFVGHGYENWFSIHPDVDVLYRDAGHILGSASVTLRIRENGRTFHFGFTGDVGRPNRPILRDPQPMPEVDYLICESTYGDQEHEQAPQETEHFLQVIEHTCVNKRGKLIIPAFSVGRTQEIVYILDQLESAGRLPDIPVYVDSPLAVNATTVFGAHPECFDGELTAYLHTDHDPFGFNRLKYIRDVEESKALNKSTDPCIIISSSGMMNAGRVKHHLFNSIDKAENTVLIVGYCSPETPGGFLRDGAQVIKLFGEWKTVRADIAIMDSFSAHGDRKELLDFIQNQKTGLKKLFLVHGTLEKQEAFSKYLQAAGFKDVVIPELAQEFELD